MQNALKDGRLKFADKQKPHSEEENETKINAFFVEPVDIMVVELSLVLGLKAANQMTRIKQRRFILKLKRS